MTVTATELAKDSNSVLDAVVRRGVTVEVQRHGHTVAEIRTAVGADSLGYLSLDGLIEAIGVPERKLCNACFHGRYPMPIDGLIDKLGLERSRT